LSGSDAAAVICLPTSRGSENGAPPVETACIQLFSRFVLELSPTRCENVRSLLLSAKACRLKPVNQRRVHR
jgi:hypothetical protein